MNVKGILLVLLNQGGEYMNRNIQSVPYGYQPQEGGPKGTLIYYDSFEQITDEQLDLAVECIEQYSFTKLVLYPLHEETVRVMLKKSISAFHKREKRLLQWKQGQDNRKDGFRSSIHT
jgi:hypothetical protein